MENYRVLLTEEQIQTRVKELGEQITKDYITHDYLVKSSVLR